MNTVMEKIDFKDLSLGLAVVDSDKDFGVILECGDIHNVLVEFDNGGSGLYCLDQKCKEYIPLFSK